MTKRRYPGEVAGNLLAERLNRLKAADEPYLFLAIWMVRDMTQPGWYRGSPQAKALRPLRKSISLDNIRTYLFGAAADWSEKRSKIEIHGVHESGLILRPTSERGQNALAVLVLDQMGMLGRMRQCAHCSTWFFARFKHQRFCVRPDLRCQWNHYHSPEWRRKNRARNRYHQTAYRSRLFTAKKKPGLRRG